MLLQSQEIDILSVLLRLLIACICGGTVGFERTKRLKEAGIRTHCIIAVTAALLMIISKYGFTDIAAGTKAADAARVAAQIIAGISFLCAGVIFKNGTSVRGLTTASGIWATSAVGMAIGGGMILEGILLALIVVLIQLIFHRVSIGSDVYSENDILISALSTDTFRNELFRLSKEKQIQILSLRVHLVNGEKICEVSFRPKRDISVRQTLEDFEALPDLRSISINR